MKCDNSSAEETTWPPPIKQASLSEPIAVRGGRIPTFEKVTLATSIYAFVGVQIAPFVVAHDRGMAGMILTAVFMLALPAHLYGAIFAVISLCRRSWIGAVSLLLVAGSVTYMIESISASTR